MPTFVVIAEHQPKVGQELSSSLMDLFQRYGAKWTHRHNPDGSGNIFEVAVSDHVHAMHVRDDLVKLGMEVGAITQAGP